MTNNTYKVTMRRTDLVTFDYTYYVESTSEETALELFESGDFESVHEKCIERRRGDECMESIEPLES